MAAPSVPEIETIDPGSVTTSDAARRTTSARWKATAYPLLGAVSFLVVWQLASQYTRTEFDLLPGPLEVAEQMGVYIVGTRLRASHRVHALRQLLGHCFARLLRVRRCIDPRDPNRDPHGYGIDTPRHFSSTSSISPPTSR